MGKKKNESGWKRITLVKIDYTGKLVMTEEYRNKEELWLGIDLGTTSAKAVLMDTDGSVVATQSSMTLSGTTSDIEHKGNEQNPEQILKVVNYLVLSLIRERKCKINGIGVTGQMHGVVFWTRDQEFISSIDHVDRVATSNLFTWQDQRCSEQFLETLPKSSQPISTGYGCATMFWLARNRPTFFTDGAFTSCGTIMDFLVSVLCGLDHPVTSDQLAASFGYFDEAVCGWSSVLQESRDFPRHLLPTVVRAGNRVGVVRASLEGWPPGVPVFVGMGDVQCAMYAMLKSAQHAAVNISTSLQLGFAISDKDVNRVRQASPECITFFPYFHGQKLALFAGLNGGNAIQYFVECIVKWFEDLGIKSDLNPAALLPQLQQMAEKETNTEGSLSIIPVFFGERHNPALAGHITGMASANFSSIGAVFKAVSQGVVDHLHSMVPSKFLVSMGIHSLTISGSVPVNNTVVKERLLQLYSELELSMDSENQEAVSSAVGAAKFVRDIMTNC